MTNNDLPCSICKGQHHPVDDCCEIKKPNEKGSMDKTIDEVFEKWLRDRSFTSHDLVWRIKKALHSAGYHKDEDKQSSKDISWNNTNAKRTQKKTRDSAIFTIKA